MQLSSLALHSWPLCSLALPSCTRPESASRPPDSPAACPSCALSSRLTSPHWCLSPGCHLPGPHHAAVRLGTDLPYQVLHSLATHVAKICHNLSFLRKSRLRDWVDSSPAPGRTAFPGCGFAHLCQWQLSQQVSPSQSLSGVGFPALAELGPHLERRAPQCACLSFVPGNLTPETVRCQVL